MEPLSAFVLAAGLGTRLRPLTAWRAKALVPVGDRPALAHVLASIGGAARVLVVNAHHRAEDVVAFAAAWPPGGDGPPLAVSREAELLGTAGGLVHAAAALGEGAVLVWNADVLAGVDVAALALAYRRDQAARGAVGTLVAQPLPPGEGNVGVDGEGRVVRLREERVGPGEVRGGAFVGVHVVGAPLRRALPPRGCLVSDGYLPALRGGAVVGVHWHPDGFIDVGSLPAYAEANAAWLRRQGRAAFVHPAAQVAGAVAVVRSVVGAGARVEGAGALEDVIVWPGATARAPLRRAVVALEGVVALP